MATLVEVHGGPFTSADLTPLSGTVVFRPAASAPLDPGIVTTATVTATLDAAGRFQAAVVDSDDPGWATDCAVHYRVELRIDGLWDSYSAYIPAPGPHDIADLIRLDAPPHVATVPTPGSEGPAGPVGPVGPARATGPAGPAGPQGEVSVGSTATGAPGSQALVTDSDPSANRAVLHFTVPRGVAGEAGAAGATGATGSQGPAGATGPVGPTGPQGVPGADSTVPGPEGPAGPPGTAYLSAQWGFNQNTAVSPASGTMRMNATTYPATTVLWIHEVDRDGLDRAAGLNTLVPGDQIIMQSAQGRAVWNVTAHADSGVYRSITVTLAESSGTRPSAGSATTIYLVPRSVVGTRSSTAKTTASLAANASEQGTITLAKAYRLLTITTSAPARVRLYTTTGKRDADVARPVGTDPTGDHGLQLEFVSTASLLSADLSPTVDGFDGKTTPDGTIPYTITNLSTFSLPAPLVPWKNALAARETAPAKVLVVGDSISEGQGASVRANRWLSLLREQLRTEYSSTQGGEGYVPAFYMVGAPDSPWQSYSSYTATPTQSYANGSLGYRTVFLDGTDTMTYSITGTDIDIWWTGGGGTLTYRVDGGTLQSFSTAGAYHTDYRTSVSLGASGAHTVVIGVSAGTVGFSGFTVFDGTKTKGIQFYDSARSGAKTADVLVEGGELVKAFQTVAPQLVIIEFGGNDALQAIPPATFQANLQTIVSAAVGSIAPTPSVLLVTPYTPAPSVIAGATWANYRAAIAAVAAADPAHIAHLDLAATMPVADTTGSGFYRTDGTHPNNTGHAEITRLIGNAIAVDGAATITATLAWIRTEQHMAYITGSVTDANPGPALHTLMATALTTAGFTLVDTVVISTRTHKVWKSPAAGNAQNLDWYLDVAYTTTGAGTIAIIPFEFYDPATDLGYRGPHAQNSGTTINPTTFSRYGATGSALETSWLTTATSANYALSLITTAFGYWISITADRVIILTSNNPSGLMYAGFYQPNPIYAAKAAANIYPLIAANLTAGIQSVTTGTPTTGVTRIPPVTTIIGGWYQTVAIPALVAPALGAYPAVPTGAQTAYPFAALPVELFSNAGLFVRYGVLRDLMMLPAGGTVIRGDTVTIGGAAHVLTTPNGNQSLLFKAA